MKKFIILTKDGFTFTKNDIHIENLQVLDILEGLNAEDALNNFKENCGEVIQNGFDDITIFELNPSLPIHSYLSKIE